MKKNGAAICCRSNVEGMYCVYCLDLPQFHAKLKADKSVMPETMRKSDWEKAPEGKGWIAEIRGYTYYHDGLKFVKEALVENLASMAIKPELLPEGGAAPGATPWRPDQLLRWHGYSRGLPSPWPQLKGCQSLARSNTRSGIR